MKILKQKTQRYSYDYEQQLEREQSMNTKTPKLGELWQMEVWSPEGNYYQNVLIVSEQRDLDPVQYGGEVSLWECLVNGQMKTLPIWMFNSAELISFNPV